MLSTKYKNFINISWYALDVTEDVVFIAIIGIENNIKCINVSFVIIIIANHVLDVWVT